MKLTITLSFILISLTSFGQAFKPTRFYGDLGLHFGAAMLYKKYSNREYRNYAFINGLYASVNVSSDRYLAKVRGSFFAGDRGNAYLTELSLLVGACYRKKFFALDASIGGGYYNVSSAELSARSTPYSAKAIGFSSEANFNFTPVKFFALSPFIFFGITSKSWNSAFGIKIGFGKYR